VCVFVCLYLCGGGVCVYVFVCVVFVWWWWCVCVCLSVWCLCGVCVFVCVVFVWWWWCVCVFACLCLGVSYLEGSNTCTHTFGPPHITTPFLTPPLPHTHTHT
jgi:hypothetical protein